MLVDEQFSGSQEWAFQRLGCETELVRLTQQRDELRAQFGALVELARQIYPSAPPVSSMSAAELVGPRAGIRTAWLNSPETFHQVAMTELVPKWGQTAVYAAAVVWLRVVRERSKSIVEHANELVAKRNKLIARPTKLGKKARGV